MQPGEHRIVGIVNDATYTLFKAHQKARGLKNAGRTIEYLLYEKTVMHIDINKSGRKPGYIDPEKAKKILEQMSKY